MAANKKVVLPPKENQLFKSILKCYEQKQYKKALKAAAAVLAKYPNHGETLAMKGLTLNSMNRKEEAYDLVKKGLRNDLTSHICWHVYGLLYRSDREYVEAIKCYLNALKFDENNQQILRDLSLLQLQMRDVNGFKDTRSKLLTLKPNNRMNWLAYAIAQHLVKDYKMVTQILNSYIDFGDEKPTKPDFEFGELLLYNNMVLEESGDYAQTLEDLSKIEPMVMDKLSVKETRASLLYKLGRKSEAEEQYRELLNLNPDNHNYHRGLQASMGLTAEEGPLTEEQVAKLEEVYNDLANRYSKKVPTSIQMIPLKFLQGEKFQIKADSILRPFLRKGLPSLFNDFKALYGEPSKAQIIEKLISSYLIHLRQKPSRFAEGLEEESPSSLLYTLIFAARHFDSCGNTGLALDLINEAIDHTPTVPDLYIIKGRIYKHAGDVDEASAQLEKARNLDLADRYINTKSTRYLLRADKVDQAEQTIGLFTKEADSPGINLFDMQCMWYELECGSSYSRTNELGKALKKYKAVEKHFLDINEDQFDFHTYCLRKMTLRSYVNLLRLEDNLYGHKYFTAAAGGIIRCYLNLFDKPATSGTGEEEVDFSTLSEAEKKVYKRKKRREEAKKAKEAQAAATAKSAKDVGKRSAQAKPTKPADEDPNGDALLKLDPLTEATKYLQMLLTHASKKLETHLLAFEVYIRKKRYLLALRAIRNASALAAPDHPEVNKIKARFISEVLTVDVLHPMVVEVLEEEKKDSYLLGGKDLMTYCREYLESSKSLTFSHKVAGVEMLAVANPSEKPALKEQLIELILATPHLKQAIEGVKVAEKLYGDGETIDTLKKKLHEKFPLALIFKEADNKNEIEEKTN